MVVISDTVLARFARSVLVATLRPFDGANELRTVVESESSSAHDLQAGHDLGMRQHVSEGIAERFLELHDIGAPQTESSGALELGIVGSWSPGLNLVFVMIECVVGGNDEPSA